MEEYHLLPSSGMTADKCIIVVENYCHKNMLMSLGEIYYMLLFIWLLATVSPFSSFTSQVFTNIP